jgi:hypothetical protein
MVNEKVEVSARILSLGAPTEGVTVTLHDGDRMFDMELLSHIGADDAHFINVPFWPETCGLHEIVVKAVGGSAIGAQAVTTLDVPCDLESRSLKGVATLKPKRNWHGKDRADDHMKLTGRFILDQPINLRHAKVTIVSLLNEIFGRGELVNGVESMVLKPVSQRGKWKTVYVSEGHEPEVKLTLKQFRNGRLFMELHVKRSDIEQPDLCEGRLAKTTLETRLVIDDEINTPIVINAWEQWECKSNRNKRIRKLKLR